MCVSFALSLPSFRRTCLTIVFVCAFASVIADPALRTLVSPPNGVACGLLPTGHQGRVRLPPAQEAHALQLLAGWRMRVGPHPAAVPAFVNAAIKGWCDMYEPGAMILILVYLLREPGQAPADVLPAASLAALQAAPSVPARALVLDHDLLPWASERWLACFPPCGPRNPAVEGDALARCPALGQPFGMSDGTPRATVDGFYGPRDEAQHVTSAKAIAGYLRRNRGSELIANAALSSPMAHGALPEGCAAIVKHRAHIVSLQAGDVGSVGSLLLPVTEPPTAFADALALAADATLKEAWATKRRQSESGGPSSKRRRRDGAMGIEEPQGRGDDGERPIVPLRKTGPAVPQGKKEEWGVPVQVGGTAMPWPVAHQLSFGEPGLRLGEFTDAFRDGIARVARELGKAAFWKARIQLGRLTSPEALSNALVVNATVVAQVERERIQNGGEPAPAECLSPDDLVVDRAKFCTLVPRLTGKGFSVQTLRAYWDLTVEPKPGRGRLGIHQARLMPMTVQGEARSKPFRERMDEAAERAAEEEAADAQIEGILRGVRAPVDRAAHAGSTRTAPGREREALPSGGIGGATLPHGVCKFHVEGKDCPRQSCGYWPCRGGSDGQRGLREAASGVGGATRGSGARRTGGQP